MNQITIKFEEPGKETMQVECAKGDSLLETAFKYDIELHHNCGGVCACSTCQIYLESGEEYVEPLSDKEEDFIDRAKNPKLISRLACQCVLLNEAEHITITIPDQRLLLGD
jgi:2Fe-2S ferredoxin